MGQLRARNGERDQVDVIRRCEFQGGELQCRKERGSSIRTRKRLEVVPEYLNVMRMES